MFCHRASGDGICGRQKRMMYLGRCSRAHVFSTNHIKLSDKSLMPVGQTNIWNICLVMKRQVMNKHFTASEMSPC